MSTAKVCLVIAMVFIGVFGTITGAMTQTEPEDADANTRLCALLFIGVTSPR